MRNLSQNKLSETYDSFNREQLDPEIVEKVDDNSACQGKENYMPHKSVVRKTAQNKKVQIVYGASS